MYITLSVIVVGFLLYAVKEYLTYWKKNGVPQYSVTKILKDHLTALFKKQTSAEVFHNYCLSFNKQRYFGIYQLFKRSIVVQDAELIKKITVKDFDHFVDHEMFCKGNEPLWDRNVFALRGKEWKDMRIILTPSFTGKKLRMMFQLILKCTEQFVQYFEKQLEDRACVEAKMKDAYSRFAGDVIASIAFGYECDSLQNPDNAFYTNSHRLMPQHSFLDNFKLFLILNVPKVAKYCRLNFYGTAGSEFFLNIITKNIKDREENGIVRHDIINLLMEARTHGNLTDVDITAQALIFFFAGVASVSSLLGFMSYELAVHVDVQKRLQKEVDDTLKSCEGNITYDVIKSMKYMEMVVLESLRKWPTGVTTDRVCTKSYIIEPENPGEVPVYIKKGDLLWLPMYSIHRNPSLFPNPEKFDPERFNEENKSKLNPYGYIPFGSGPRICIANRFTKTEVKLLFLQILSKFDIVTVDKTVVPIRLAKYSTQMIAEDGFWLGFRKRSEE